MPKLMERHLQIPPGEYCLDCPFYQCDSTPAGCNNGMIFSTDVTKGKWNAECRKEFPHGGTIWFEKGKA